MLVAIVRSDSGADEIKGMTRYTITAEHDLEVWGKEGNTQPIATYRQWHSILVTKGADDE